MSGPSFSASVGCPESVGRLAPRDLVGPMPGPEEAGRATVLSSGTGAAGDGSGSAEVAEAAAAAMAGLAVAGRLTPLAASRSLTAARTVAECFGTPGSLEGAGSGTEAGSVGSSGSISSGTGKPGPCSGVGRATTSSGGPGMMTGWRLASRIGGGVPASSGDAGVVVALTNGAGGGPIRGVAADNGAGSVAAGLPVAVMASAAVKTATASPALSPAGLPLASAASCGGVAGMAGAARPARGRVIISAHYRGPLNRWCRASGFGRGYGSRFATGRPSRGGPAR